LIAALVSPAQYMPPPGGGTGGGTGGGSAPSGAAGTIQASNGAGAFAGDPSVAKLVLTSVGTATAPVLTYSPGYEHGTTTYTYYIVWISAVGPGLLSPATTTTTGAAALDDTTSFNVLNTVCPAGAVQWAAVHSLGSLPFFDGDLASNRFVDIEPCGTPINDTGEQSNNAAAACGFGNIFPAVRCSIQRFGSGDASTGVAFGGFGISGGNFIVGGVLPIQDFTLNGLPMLSGGLSTAVPVTGIAPQTEYITTDSPNGFDTNEFMYAADASGGAVTITLPSAKPGLTDIGTGQNETNGQWFGAVKLDASANTVTLAASGTDKINDASSIVLTKQYEYVIVEQFNENGVNEWLVLTHYVPGVSVAGTACTVTQITAGVITAATCTP
jgi:hypothetical protein